MRLLAGNLYASYIVHVLRWSPGVQALLLALLLTGGGGLVSVIVARVFKPKMARIACHRADAEIISDRDAHK